MRGQRSCGDRPTLSEVADGVCVCAAGRVRWRLASSALRAGHQRLAPHGRRSLTRGLHSVGAARSALRPVDQLGHATVSGRRHLRGRRRDLQTDRGRAKSVPPAGAAALPSRTLAVQHPNAARDRHMGRPCRAPASARGALHLPPTSGLEPSARRPGRCCAASVDAAPDGACRSSGVGAVDGPTQWGRLLSVRGCAGTATTAAQRSAATAVPRRSPGTVAGPTVRHTPSRGTVPCR
jgi:hypothetical protein